MPRLDTLSSTVSPHYMNRADMLSRLRSQSGEWDILVIGGGATGVGIAIDAASRGYSTLLLEAYDFGKGTSTRSTKLVHGGVRYLEQGNIALVMDALKERGLLRQNAPHLVSQLGFVIPNYRWWEAPFYGIGMQIYNLLAGKRSFGWSRMLSRKETLFLLPTLKPANLRSGVIYYDGQFDDARLLINMAATAAAHGATLLNYLPVQQVTLGSGNLVNGVVAIDTESGEEFTPKARIVINATGPFADSIRHMSSPRPEPMIAPSQGIHLVFDRSFLPGDVALMIPHTSDGRVLFAIPWHGHTLVGTTDTPIPAATFNPAPQAGEIEFILSTARQYLARQPTAADILSIFTGIRPLVKSNRQTGRTAALSRDHTIRIDESRLVTIAGGKWTTYRRMAQDCVTHAAAAAGLPPRKCLTQALPIHGSAALTEAGDRLSIYGSDAPAIRQLAVGDPSLATPISAAFPYTPAEIVWACRHEMARTIEDVLARRTRALFLNCRAALNMAPQVADLMCRELNRDQTWKQQQLAAFSNVAAQFDPIQANHA